MKEMASLIVLVDVALARVKSHQGMISDFTLRNAVEQLEWIKTSYSPALPKSELPEFNLGRLNVAAFYDLDAPLAELINRILTKIGFDQEHKRREREAGTRY